MHFKLVTWNAKLNWSADISESTEVHPKRCWGFTLVSMQSWELRCWMVVLYYLIVCDVCVCGWYIFVFWFKIIHNQYLYAYIDVLYVYVNRYSANICAHVLMHPLHTCFFTERILQYATCIWIIHMYIANKMCGAFPLYCMMECLVQTYSTRWIQMMPSRLWVHWVIYCKTSKYWCTKKNWARPKSHVLEHNRIQYGHCATFPIWQFWGGCKYVRKMWRFHSRTAGLLSQETDPQLPPK